MFELIEGKGQPYPYGTSICGNYVNFSVYAPDAAEVWISFFDRQEQPLGHVKLKDRIKSNWFGAVTGVVEGDYYGYRVLPKAKHDFIQTSKQKLLIDPYARKLSRALNWQPDKYKDDSQRMISKSVITDSPSQHYQLPSYEFKNRIIYEAHVKGLSMLHPEVPESLRGSYLGACHPVILRHLKSLGVTTIQFQPLMAFMPEPFIVEKGLTNYWGYNPVNFFAVEPRYAINDAYTECREMIKIYRDHGFEVILDVVFNHTAESGQGGPVLNFKGFCASKAYLLEHQEHGEFPTFANYSGCGNTLQVSDRYMLNLVLDAMRYWVSHMGINGFRFDLASTLAREPFDFRADATFFKIVNQDPVLSQSLLIAEPWDIGPGGYQVGNFPTRWLEVNDKFRDVVKGFWRGDKGLKGEFASRFMGSRDIYCKTRRSLFTSVNNVTYHDGYTLHDLVCYEQKHNEDNLEHNRDGHNHNLSANYGVEGETTNTDILEIRYQQKRNLFATLVLSQGSVHVTAGDELSKTQNGNNNAYCQDNEINYLHWELNHRQQAFLKFCRYIIALKAKYNILSSMHFEDDKFENKQNVAMTDWYRPDGSHKTEIDWVYHEHHCFAMHLISDDSLKQEWMFCFNSADREKQFKLDVLDDKQNWNCILDTSCDDIEEYQYVDVHSVFDMPARSLRILLKTNAQ